MKRRWEIYPPNPSLQETFSRELEISPLTAQVLANRGINQIDQAYQFLHPSLSHLHSPFLMKDMDKAVDRVIQALSKQEQVLIYGDYDVDGVTSIAILILFFQSLQFPHRFYIPHRIERGYGLHPDIIGKFAQQGVKLIITADCGISDMDAVKKAQEMGVDVIITDHHEPTDALPDASAIINPKTMEDEYPGGELSGVGVAFKFAQAIYRRLGQDESELEDHLDLVALGTAADIVPLVRENRIFTKFGMAQIAKTTKPGLKSLIFVSGILGQKIGTGQVVFILAPRINAVGRLGDADLAIRLLTTRDESKAAEMARILDDENQRRKNIDETTLKEALDLIEQNVDLANDKAIVLASSGWHQGVIGIVASRLAERFHRPTIMIAIDQDEGKGSARSIPGFHLYEALRECEEYLTQYGGHKYAAGISILPEKIQPFREKFKKVSDEKLSRDDLLPRLLIDSELELEQINPELVKVLDLFAPFGPQNMRPVFLTRNLKIWGEPHVVGNNHLRLRVKKAGPVFDCIGFGMGDMTKLLFMKGIRIDLAYVVDTNFWNDTYKIQLRIKDLRISELMI